MPFMRIHTAAMRQTAALIEKNCSFSLNPGGWLDNMEPDLNGPKHGYDVEGDDGNIIEEIIAQFHTLEECLALLFECDPIDQGYNQRQVERVARYITHYLADAFSLGQISRRYWGGKDNRMDAAGEFVCLGQDTQFDYIFDSTLQAELFILDMVHQTFELFHDPPKSTRWTYIFSTNFREMVRREVWMAASVSAGLFALALRGARERIKATI